VIAYQTIIYAAGQGFRCVEAYDSLYERLRDGVFRMDSDDEGMRWIPPLEVTVEGETGPLRALIAPTAISAVVEIPEALRTEVE
jgi:hypothetical protein